MLQQHHLKNFALFLSGGTKGLAKFGKVPLDIIRQITVTPNVLEMSPCFGFTRVIFQKLVNTLKMEQNRVMLDLLLVY